MNHQFLTPPARRYTSNTNRRGAMEIVPTRSENIKLSLLPALKPLGHCPPSPSSLPIAIPEKNPVALLSATWKSKFTRRLGKTAMIREARNVPSFIHFFTLRLLNHVFHPLPPRSGPGFMQTRCPLNARRCRRGMLVVYLPCNRWKRRYWGRERRRGGGRRRVGLGGCLRPPFEMTSLLTCRVNPFLVVDSFWFCLSPSCRV